MCRLALSFILRWGVRISLAVLLVGLLEHFVFGQPNEHLQGFDPAAMLYGVLSGNGIETMRLSLVLLVCVPVAGLVTTVLCAFVGKDRKLSLISAGVLLVIVLAAFLRF